MNPLVWIGNALRWVAGLLVPMFVRPRLSPGLLWTLHFFLITGIAALLWFLQKHYQWTINIEGPVWMRPFWLSILFLLVYFLAWQAWWLWKLLQPGEAVSPFPDIDESWATIMAALEKSGIGLADTPVFVVIGLAQSGEASLFSALPHSLIVNGAGGAAVRVYANRDAAYLVCPSATLLSVQGFGGADVLGDSFAPASMGMEASIGMDKSIGMSGAGGGETIQQVQRIIKNAQAQNRALSEQEKQQIRQLSSVAGFTPEKAAAGPGRASVLQDARLVERQTARMRYFCALVARSRWPLCPVNGAIILVPIGSAEKDEVAQQTGLVAQKDLSTMVDAFRLRFPVYTLIADLETLPGAGEFLRRFGADRRHQRLGKSFPLNPDLKPSAVPEAVETSTNWIFQSLLPYWVYKLFRLETPNVETPAEAARANGDLFQFLAAVKERAEKVSRLVSRAVMARADEVPAYGGCYLTALEPGGSAEPLFAQEFFKKVESTQGFVTWTDEAFALDASYRAMTKTGYIALGLIAAAVAALAVYVWGIKQ